MSPKLHPSPKSNNNVIIFFLLARSPISGSPGVRSPSQQRQETWFVGWQLCPWLSSADLAMAQPPKSYSFHDWVQIPAKPYAIKLASLRSQDATLSLGFQSGLNVLVLPGMYTLRPSPGLRKWLPQRYKLFIISLSITFAHPSSCGMLTTKEGQVRTLWSLPLDSRV